MARGKLCQLFLVSVALSHTVAKELTLPALKDPKARTASHIAKSLGAWSVSLVLGRVSTGRLITGIIRE